MIVVDIETSGMLDSNVGIWQIGAVEFENPSNTFLEDGRIDDSDVVEEGALIVTGKTEGELRDRNKQAQSLLIERFFNWAGRIDGKVFVAHNTPFDFGFLSIKARKYGIDFPFKTRSIDLHTLAMLKYYQIHGKFYLDSGLSAMSLPRILEFCGIQDERISLKDGKVVKEGKPHNGLDDAMLEAECLSRIVYGKNLLEKFLRSDVPKYLQNKI